MISAPLACLLAGALAGITCPLQSVPTWELDWQAGHRETAVDELQQQLSSHGGEASLALLLARRQLLVHRYEAALATAASLGPPGRPLRARCHYLLGHYEQAIAELDPDDPGEVLMLVDSHEVLGHGEPTLQALARARELLGADNAALATAEGRAAARAGRHEEALADFRRALVVDPFDNQALFGLGRSLMVLGQRDEATEVLERHHQLVPLMDRRELALQAIDMAPLHGDNFAQLGDVERAIGRLDHAQAAYQQAAQLADPAELAPIVLRHARLLAEDLQRTDEAVALLDLAASRGADVRVTVRAGDLLLAEGRPQAAISRYDAALERRPGDSLLLARRQRAAATLQAPPGEAGPRTGVRTGDADERRPGSDGPRGDGP